MAFTPCPSECVLLPPLYGQDACDQTIEPGGVSNIIVTSCDVPDLTSLTLAQICTFIAAGKVSLSPSLLGQIAEADTESSDTRSCSPATITGYTWNLEFESYDHDRINYGDYSFWNDLKRTYTRYRFYYISCEGLLFGVVPSPSFSVSKMREQKNTQKAGWMGALSWQGYDDLVPVKIPGLQEALAGGCVDTPDVGFRIATEFATTLPVQIGGGAIVINQLVIVREAGCTNTIVVSIEGIEVFTGGPKAPIVIATSLPAPLLTGATISVNPDNADVGIYDIIYRISGCADSYVRSLRVTVTPTII